MTLEQLNHALAMIEQGRGGEGYLVRLHLRSGAVTEPGAVYAPVHPPSPVSPSGKGAPLVRLDAAINPDRQTWIDVAAIDGVELVG